MIISPPYLPAEGLHPTDVKWQTDPMMDAVDKFEPCHHGVFPIAFDRRWHCGMHLIPYGGLGQNEPVRAIADGEVVVYRVSRNEISDGEKDSHGSPVLNSTNGFVLLKHSTDTGEGRTITFYSLYMHLLNLTDMNQLSPQSNHPPPDSSPDALPIWLLRDTDGVVAGGGKKVRRKDRLGLTGRCHGNSHLHFEIFMTEDDFSAYFGRKGSEIDLGRTPSRTPERKDYWGHTYFVIPKGATFVSVPPGLAEIKTKNGAPFFPALNRGSLDSESTLYVETYFNRGERFMRSWIDRGDGKLVSLTREPVRDTYAEFEYDLYERATTLYPTCPSDGYELLRFGRILNPDEPKLPPTERATWLTVPFSADKMGYIDVNQSTVLKLSDADFPAFMDWQKIESGNTPFNADGFCGFDTLCKITGVPEDDWYTPEKMLREVSHDDRVASYVRYNDRARVKLRGFVCHARSEWDASWDADRFKDLEEPNGFFGTRKETDPHGFENFLKFSKQFKFMERTPFGEGKKFWFFHPMAFVRHFRKCAWLSNDEFAQIYSDSRYSVSQHLSPDALRSRYLVPMNLAMRKFGFSTGVRQSHFLGQGAVESSWLAKMQESSMLGKLDPSGFHGMRINPASLTAEAELGHWYGQLSTECDAWFSSTKFNSKGVRISGSYDWRNGNCDKEDSQKFRGRGFKQLTGRSNYASYWTFRGWIASSSFSPNWWTDPSFIARDRAGMTLKPAEIPDPQRIALPGNCIDSGGFYLRFERPRVMKAIDKDVATVAERTGQSPAERNISREVTYAINGGYIQDDDRLTFTKAAKRILL